MPAIPTMTVHEIDVDLHEVQIGPVDFSTLKQTLEGHRAWLISPDNDTHGRYSIMQSKKPDDSGRYINYYFECRDTAFSFKLRWK
jgi:hypothetical protein